ncbi:MAG: hypothetical protein HY941_11810 [Gammaproteobacteria bacterium]|nr:hypothetical protein [Gammaproteobacteria bacterium]
MSKIAVIVLAGIALGGCNQGLVRDPPSLAHDNPGNCAKLDDSADVQLGLVRQMLDQNRAYAGLAHLAALDPAVQASAQARYLNAELLRHTGRVQDAERSYRDLLGTCLAGYGHHGLGLLLAERNLQQALAELRQAALLLPTDSRVRNDLGYALLLAQDGPGARREFMTAIELGDYKQRASLNLVLLMLYEGDEQGAERLSQRLKVPEAELEQLRRQAVQLKKERQDEPHREG